MSGAEPPYPHARWRRTTRFWLHAKPCHAKEARIRLDTIGRCCFAGEGDATRRVALATGFVLACVLGAWTGTARADVIETFAALGAYHSGSSLSGTLTIDTTAGSISAVDLLISAPENFVLTSLIDSGDLYGPGTTSLYGYPNASTFVVLLLPSSLVGYAGGPIASDNFSLNGAASDIGIYGSPNPDDSLVQGSLTEVPEPSSLITFGSGLGVLSLTWFVRRRRPRC